jgi:proline dehydrogenase
MKRLFSTCLYNKINLQNTKNAYKLMSTDELIKQRNIYKLFSIMPKNQTVNNTLINLFMNIKLPVLYTKIETTLFNQYCGGTNLINLNPLLVKLNTVNVSPLLYNGIEHIKTTEEADIAKIEMCKLIDCLVQHKSGKAILRISGIMSHERLIKVQNNEQLNFDEHILWKKDLQRLYEICEYSVNNKIPIMFDAEESTIQRIIHQLSIDMMRIHNKDKPYIYSTIQFYCKDSEDKLDKLLTDAYTNKYIVGIKLVRGAYIFDETKNNKRNIIHNTKEQTDNAYNNSIIKCIYNIDKVSSCFATHNIESTKLVIHELDKLNIKAFHPHISMAQVYGMRKEITFNLENINVSQFIPYGSKKYLFPYLVRRGIENTSALNSVNEELILMNKELQRRYNL